jgi:hypothetical protein
MPDPAAEPATPWARYVGAIVMTGMTIALGINACVAAALGSNSIERISFETACSCAFAALCSLAYAATRRRRIS